MVIMLGLFKRPLLCMYTAYKDSFLVSAYYMISGVLKLLRTCLRYCKCLLNPAFSLCNNIGLLSYMSCLLVTPLDVVKTRLQAQLKPIPKCM